MMKRNSFFVDAAAWIALFNVDDKYHDEAVQFWRFILPQKPTLVTTYYVLDETYTNLRRARDGYNRAVRAHDTIEASNFVTLYEVDQAAREEGWNIFRRYDDKIMSFTDCVSFGMMRRLGVDSVFTFDADFLRAGFRVWPETN